MIISYSATNDSFFGGVALRGRLCRRFEEGEIMNYVKVPRQEAIYRTMHNAIPAYRNYNQGIGRLPCWKHALKKKPASILEVGCGNGILCKKLVDMGHDVTGLDIVHGPYDREGYEFVKHDIELGYLPFVDKSFDYCLSFDVIEHLHTRWGEHHVWDMLRVSHQIIGTIACFERVPLHTNVKEPEYWKEIISRHSEKEMHYFVYYELKGKTLLFYTKKEN